MCGTRPVTGGMYGGEERLLVAFFRCSLCSYRPYAMCAIILVLTLLYCNILALLWWPIKTQHGAACASVCDPRMAWEEEDSGQLCRTWFMCGGGMGSLFDQPPPWL